MEQKNFLSFKNFERFERDIRYDVSVANLESKIERSQAFKMIVKQGKLILPEISEFLLSESRIETEAHFYTIEISAAWIKLLDKIASENDIKAKPALTDNFKMWTKWLNTQKYFPFKVAEKKNTIIILNISDEACLPLGFPHKEMLINPSNNIVEIASAAPGKDGLDVLWYIIQHPTVHNEVCCWAGEERNLAVAGFVKIENQLAL